MQFWVLQMNVIVKIDKSKANHNNVEQVLNVVGRIVSGAKRRQYATNATSNRSTGKDKG